MVPVFHLQQEAQFAFWSTFGKVRKANMNVKGKIKKQSEASRHGGQIRRCVNVWGLGDTSLALSCLFGEWQTGGSERVKDLLKVTQKGPAEQHPDSQSGLSPVSKDGVGRGMAG